MDLIDGGGEAGDLARWGINSKFCVFFYRYSTNEVCEVNSFYDFIKYYIQN